MITDENRRLSNITGEKAINDHKVDIVIYIQITQNYLNMHHCVQQ